MAKLIIGIVNDDGTVTDSKLTIHNLHVGVAEILYSRLYDLLIDGE